MADPTPLVHILFSVFLEGVVLGQTYTSSDDFHIWDGEEPLTITPPGGVATTFDPVGYALSVGIIETKTGIPDQRMQVSLGVDDDNTKAKTILAQDFGPLPLELRYLASNNGGKTWGFLPIYRKGRASNMQWDSGVLSVEMETPRGDITRGVPRFWSHELQQKRYPGDKGLEFLSRMQEGYQSIFPFGFHPDDPLTAG